MPKKTYIAADIGGTKTIVAKTTASGRILEQIKVKTDYQEYSELLDLLVALHDDTVQAIGIGIAGVVDQSTGRFLSGPNLPDDWAGLELPKIISKRFRCPVAMDNDVNCFALGEATYGAAQGHDTVLGITVGTGVGGGIVINGRLHRGAIGAGGEIGHMTVACDLKIRSRCGARGHLETLAAGRAITDNYFRLSKRRLSVREISALARKNDRRAKKVVSEAGRWLGVGLSAATYLINPNVIVVGGGLAKTCCLLQSARASFVEQTCVYPELAATPIVKSKLGAEANLLGATRLAMTDAKQYH
jgi:glucokinase